MSKYQRGKIYKLCSKQTDEIYIGSTTQSLNERLKGHKWHFSYWKRGKGGSVSSFKILKHNDVYIELIEKYPCENKFLLLQKEAEYIQKLDCVNKNIAGNYLYQNCIDDKKTQIAKYNKSYYSRNKKHMIDNINKNRLKNREKSLQRMKDYNEKHKERLSAWRKEKIHCICGSIFRRGDKAKHFKTIRHRLYIHNLHNIFNHL